MTFAFWLFISLTAICYSSDEEIDNYLIGTEDVESPKCESCRGIVAAFWIARKTIDNERELLLRTATVAFLEIKFDDESSSWIPRHQDNRDPDPFMTHYYNKYVLASGITRLIFDKVQSGTEQQLFGLLCEDHLKHCPEPEEHMS